MFFGVGRQDQDFLVFPCCSSFSFAPSLAFSVAFADELAVTSCGFSSSFPNHRQAKSRSRLLDLFDSGDDLDEVETGRILQGQKAKKGSWTWQVRIDHGPEYVEDSLSDRASVFSTFNKTFNFSMVPYLSS